MPCALLRRFEVIRRILNILTVAAVLFFGILAILAAPAFFDPAFVVVNNSREPVFVVAKWRNDAKQIGNIGAMSSFEFSLDAEAAIRFRVSYPDGATAESKPIYFTRGTKVIATITSDGVTVGYDHEN